MIVFLNGRYIDARKAQVSVFDHGFLYGDGVYETLRTYGGKIWQLQEHLKRLRRSTKLLKIGIPWSDEQLGGFVKKLLQKNGFKESRIRITVSRGKNDFDFLTSSKPTLAMIVQKLQKQPSEIYREGVSLITLPWKRLLPEAKTSSLLPYILAQQAIHLKKAYEGLFLGTDGSVLEGTITNITAVFGNSLAAPKTGVLPGCTQKTVLELAKRHGMKVEMKNLSLKQLFSADEIFLTSTVRGIIPVRSVDGKKIGKACPGPVTKNLRKIFAHHIDFKK